MIGYNTEWKQDINIGKVNNQNFVNIPFYKLILILLDYYYSKKEAENEQFSKRFS